MLALLRRHSRSWLIWAIFIVLILVFIFFFGPQTEGFAPSNRSWAVRAPGATIYDTQLNSTLQRTLDLTGRRGRLDDEEFATRRRQIAENIALIHVLAERARDEGLEISRDELSCYIVNWDEDYLVGDSAICEQFPAQWSQRYPNVDYPFYATAEGGFSESYIMDVRGRFNMSIEEYERWKRTELLAMRYLHVLADALPVSATSVQAMAERRGQTVDLEFIRFSDTLPVATVDDEEIARLVRDEESTLRARYAASEESFREEASIRLRQIYINRPSDPAESEAMASTVATIVEEASAEGADFTSLANTHSTLGRDDGGDLGWRTRDTLASDVWERAVELSVGEVALVEQSSAWRIIRMEERREERVRPFSEVAEDLARDLVLEEQATAHRERQERRARRVLALAREGLSLEDAVVAEAAESGLNEGAVDVADAQLSLEVERTGAFALERSPQRFGGMGNGMQDFVLPAAPSDQVPGIGTSAELVRIAFGLTEQNPLHPEPIQVEGTTFVVRLAERNTTVTSEALREAERTLREELADNLLHLETVRRRLLLHDPGASLPAFLERTLDEAIGARRVRFRSRVFEVPVDTSGPVSTLAD